MKSQGVQCDLLSAPPLKVGNLSEVDPSPPMETDDPAPNDDPEYQPLEEELEQYEEEMGLAKSVPETESSTNIHGEPKYIVFQSALRDLLKWCHCPKCGCQEISEQQWTLNGSLLNLTILCSSCCAQSSWQSQPFIKKVPACNLLMAASILYAGATPTKVLRVFKHLCLAAIS